MVRAGSGIQRESSFGCFFVEDHRSPNMFNFRLTDSVSQTSMESLDGTYVFASPTYYFLGRHHAQTTHKSGENQ
jgi:hypothetical protein